VIRRSDDLAVPTKRRKEMRALLLSFSVVKPALVRPAHPVVPLSRREHPLASFGSWRWSCRHLTAVVLVLLGLVASDAYGQVSTQASTQDQATKTRATAKTEKERNGKRPQEQPVHHEDIIVTARKTEELLQDVPLSVTAFTADAMSQRNMTTIEDISARTPGMHYGDFHDEKLSPLSLRGIVSDSGSAGADPAVAQYVDDVYIGQGAGAYLDLFGLERVEVLRGPQGVFFGRNAIGGAVSYVTRKPANEFEAMFEGNYGDYAYHRAGALVSGPLVKNKLDGKLSLVSNGRNGTFRNLWLHRDVNTIGSWSGRGQLLWTPAPGTQLTLAAEHDEVDQESLSMETLRYNGDSLLVQALDASGLPRNRNPYDRKVYADTRQPETLNLSGYSARLTTPIGNALLTSITSYREHRYSSLRDTDATPLRWSYDGDPERVERFSQELRAEWWAPKATLLIGAYFFDQTSHNESFIRLGEDLTSLLIGEPMVIETGSDAKLKTTTYAVFSNATFSLGSRADVSVGFRYTRDEKHIDYAQNDPLSLLGGTFSVRAGDHWGAVTPAFSLRYRFADDIKGYVNISRGSKSGGFNDALGTADGLAFGPEFLWNYEVGLKSRFAHGRVTVNLDTFFMDWSRIQILIQKPGSPTYSPITANAGTAHSTGFEGEIVATPSLHWLLGLNFSVIRAKYVGGTQPGGLPLDKIPFSPAYTANFNAQYRGRLTHTLDWFAGGEILRSGELYLTADNQPDGRVDPYTLVNARLGFGAADGRWRLTLWGKNVTDKTVKQRLFDLYDNPLVGEKFIELNDPAVYGVTLGVTL
jgi:iron complex outermembrane recepter protein